MGRKGAAPCQPRVLQNHRDPGVLRRLLQGGATIRKSGGTVAFFSPARGNKKNVLDRARRRTGTKFGRAVAPETLSSGAQMPDPVVATYLERTLGKDFTPAVAARLSEAGLDAQAPLPRQLKVAKIARWLEAIRAEVYPDLPPEEGARALGRRALDGLGHSFGETALLAFLRVIGPEKALAQAESRLRRTVLGLTVSESSRKAAVLHVNDAQGMPHFVQGLLEAFGPKVGAPDVQVEMEPDGKSGATYRVTWR